MNPPVRIQAPLFPLKRSSLAHLAVVLFCICFGVSGCNSARTIGGRQISIVFRDAEGLKSGDALYIAGLQVGVVSDIAVVSGRAMVRASLFRQSSGAVAAGTVFLVSPDPSDATRSSLTGYTATISPDPSKAAETFYGASNRIELLGLVGADKIKSLFDSVVKP